jgi:hypothetical protein
MKCGLQPQFNGTANGAFLRARPPIAAISRVAFVDELRRRHVAPFD